MNHEIPVHCDVGEANKRSATPRTYAELAAEIARLQLKWESDEPGQPGRMYRGLLKLIADLTDSHGSSRPASCYVLDMANALAAKDLDIKQWKATVARNSQKILKQDRALKVAMEALEETERDGYTGESRVNARYTLQIIKKELEGETK